MTTDNTIPNEETLKDDVEKVEEETDETPAVEPEENQSADEEESAESVVAEIQEELGEEKETEKEEADTKPKAKEPHYIDINNLTPEAVNALREAFEKTPKEQKAEDRYYTVSLREKDGRYIVEVGKAFLAMVHNAEERRDELKQFITVRFHGEKEMETIRFKEFMNLERVDCRIVGMNENKVNTPVGTTKKRDENGGLTAQLVIMYVNRVVVTFSLKLPTGEVIEVQEDHVNK